MELNSEQNKVLTNFKLNKNILVTGPAGTGKSFLINQIKENAKIINKNVAITAMTGCAAWNIQGKTIHSWGGIGTGEKPLENLIKNIYKNKNTKDRWCNIDTLIIDEVSMLTLELFEKLDGIAKSIRKNYRPFGGIQLILLGDFYQLPPINNGEKEVAFCFESPIWNSSINVNIVLKDIIRQTDPILQTCLNEIRVGKCSDQTEKILNSCLEKNVFIEKGDIIPTKIYGTKSKIREINEKELKSLNNQIYDFNLITQKQFKKNKDIHLINKDNIDYYAENLDKYASYENNLKLCIGAQVMLLVNLDTDTGLINGSRGIVTDFVKNNETNIKSPVVRFLDGREILINPYNWEFEEKDFKIIKTQIPLQLAWAITIHKIQGATLNLALIDAGLSIFEYGQSYVALSRVTSIDGLYLNSFSKKKIKAHPKVIKFYEKLENFNKTNIKKNIFDHFSV